MPTYLTTGLLGSFWVISFCCLWNKENLFISEIGKRTMDIMVLHYPPIPVLYMVTYVFALFGFETSVFAITIIVLVVSFYLSKTLCDKTRLYFKRTH